MFEDTAGMTSNQPHSLRQVAIEVLVREEVHFIGGRPGISLVVFPAPDDSQVLVSPVPLLTGSKGCVGCEEFILREQDIGEKRASVT